ncbi:Ig-like domain-containing protein [Archangium lipolyticum]|uniref:Ig-like domain-containing protein n=1 Tax=Archangium lipolyticum TaxID=2970465 RepID=UPI00214A7092|nr:Ig-like domain-containing protein [Archangium lipolyticum]
MHRLLKLTGALALVLGTTACPGIFGGDDEEGEPLLQVSARPTRIDDKGQVATLTVSATDAKEEPGTGSVELTAAAGLLGDGQTTVTLTLDETGTATTTFKCDKALDSNCKGAVSIEGKWSGTTAKTTVTVGSTVVTPDAGTGDAGTGDAGTDGGFDGGVTTVFSIDIAFSKPVVVANTGDQTTVTVTAIRNSTSAPVADGTPITFTSDKGSFQPTPGVKSITVNTTSGGKASAPLYVANDTPGQARITATVENETKAAQYSFLSVSSVTYVPTTATKALLGLESSGRETTTPITFKVLNANAQPVPGIDVSFEVSGAAGASVTPSGTTDAQGQVSTTLRSGNTVGVAIVRAVVTATRSSTPSVDANHTGTPIVGGKPSDRGLTVDCVRKNLGALHATPPPRKGINTNCTAKLVDRFGNPVGLATPVQWYPEAGSISSPVNSKPQAGSTPAAGTGEAVTVFNTDGAFPPYPVTPLTGEKYDGSATNPNDPNPRDMAVTVIAVVAGEEEFADGSGTTTVKNGRWDPGEWFVDLGEPLVDRNDNGVWDPGEDFIDTERIDCADPSKPATRNGSWDGPNGCWDGNTQIWRAIHLVYTGPLASNHLVFKPYSDNYFVPVEGQIEVDFIWGDAYYNRMSTDGANFSVVKVSGSRGSAELASAGGVGAFDYGGFNIDYNTRVATTQADGSLQIGGTCDTGAAMPGPVPSTPPVKVRCVRTVDYNFNGVANGNYGTIRMKGGTAPAKPTPGTVELRATHSFSASPAAALQATFE